ncbi:GNAT family N-acetyltransferase [Bradyrhizobium ontarionense]|uniref:GNAT family N-acetyltransferase n=1 Tax=Bradyrhizobium ontarionense TaxID=2898149 RepID=A0ABY3R9H0_9BRAD|nr:GNAT family N-acetyltransferase [Bradyrhizobium sp. A19]UFZ03412.1 GNAT family N-acetyltransferase [Bradyrhizobium sp. A19]
MRRLFVATIGNRIVGTASLEGNAVRTVFVAPDVQARGVGKLLMAEIDRAAREQHMPVLTLRSSVTAEAFNARLGFGAARDSYHGDERTILMERALDESL